MANSRSLKLDVNSLKTLLQTPGLDFSLDQQKIDNGYAEAHNHVNAEKWKCLNKATQEELKETHIYGKDSHFKTANTKARFNNSLHTSGALRKLTKEQVESSILDCVNRVVIQPNPFIDKSLEIVFGLIQGTVVSPAFIEYESNDRPGGEFFLKNWCEPPVANPTTLTNEYTLSADGEKKLAEHIFQTALLYFRALDFNGCTTCVIPDVGTGAYLKALAGPAKEIAQQIIRTAWQEAAKQQRFMNLKNFIFTYNNPVKPEQAIENIAQALITYAPGKDNLRVAMLIVEKFPQGIVGVTIAGGVQGMGGEFLINGKGSQEEAIYRSFGNMTGPMLMEGLQLTEKDSKSHIFKVSHEVPKFTLAIVNNILPKPAASLTLPTSTIHAAQENLASSNLPPPLNTNATSRKPDSAETLPPPSNTDSACTEAPTWNSDANVTKILNALVMANDYNWVKDPAKQTSVGIVISDQHNHTFTVAPDHFKTHDTDIETFKAMLISFLAIQPGKTPEITVNNANLVTLWKKAAAEIPIVAQIKSSAPSAQSPEPTESPSPQQKM